MIKKLTAGELEAAKSNFAGNDPLEFITRSALISLSDLEQFIQETRAGNDNVDGIRVYFIRFKPEDIPAPVVNESNQVPEGCKFLLVKNDKGEVFTQAGIAIVPVCNLKEDDSYFTFADDLIIDGSVNVLMPGTENKATGLNPPPDTEKKKVPGTN